MTKDEFNKKVKEIFEKFNESDDHEYLLILTEFADHKLKGIGYSGYGCAACTLEEVQVLVEAGKIVHNKKQSVN